MPTRGDGHDALPDELTQWLADDEARASRPSFGISSQRLEPPHIQKKEEEMNTNMMKVDLVVFGDWLLFRIHF